MPNNTISPLRYPGGKNKLFNYTKNLINNNSLTGCTYIEAFAGGAGLAMTLLFKNVVNNIILNDLDRSIYAFWYSVLNHTNDLCILIENTPITIEEWNKQRLVQANKGNESILTLGFSTFFLNRTNRSGILTGGVIGGQKQNSDYKMDCRFNKMNLISKIGSIAEKKHKIEVYNLDAVDFINRVITKESKHSFIFIDPPYYKKGPGLYVNHYKHSDHKNLAEVVSSVIKQPWIITYDNVEPIKEIYRDYIQKEYDLTYSAQKKCIGKEVMIYSPNIYPIEFV